MKGEANVAVLDDPSEEVLAVKKTVSELFQIADKTRDARVEAEEKVNSLKIEFSLLKHRKPSFDEATNAVNKELSAARLECATLWWNRDEVLLKLKMLETDP